MRSRLFSGSYTIHGWSYYPHCRHIMGLINLITGARVAEDAGVASASGVPCLPHQG